MDHIYTGIKRLSYDTGTYKITNMLLGVRIVTIDGKTLESALEAESKFDWGVSCNRNRGMNLSLAILASFFKEEVEVPNEFTYRFFKDLISKLDDEWEFTTSQLKSYCERVYKEIYGEEVAQ